MSKANGLYGLRTYKVRRMNPPDLVPSQAVPGKYFRPHLVNRVDFAPSIASAQTTAAPAVAVLQADTAVIWLQPYL